VPNCRDIARVRRKRLAQLCQTSRRLCARAPRIPIEPAVSGTLDTCLHDLNPFPCGYAGDKKRVCRCPAYQIERYRSRISGPLIDRFDIHVQLPPVPVNALQESASGEGSAEVRTRVRVAREWAAERAAGAPAITSNLQLLKQLEVDARLLLLRSIDVLGLSLRAYSKALRVARTIADLASSEVVRSTHVAEAIQYRLLDREVHAAERSAAEQRAMRATT
jgi:magnesium chelatase family protein